MSPPRSLVALALGFVWLVSLGTLVACDSQPTRVDHSSEKDSDQGADPWSTSSSGHKKKGDDDDKGFDLRGAFEKIKQAVETPGPYEMPEHSSDFNEAKPHWGVMRLHGAIVER